MLKLWNTKISVSQCGMWVAKTKFDHCGGITTRIPKVTGLMFYSDECLKIR